jgi:isopenicillin N synthase-like dioxygenase
MDIAMTPEIISYNDLLDNTNTKVKAVLEAALLQKGIVGIKDVPDFETTSQRYVTAARAFAALPETTKEQYKPHRDAGVTEGYELGAERFKNKNGEWQIDGSKASYYAYVPDQSANKWPTEVDLRTAYLELGELIFKTGKQILDSIGLNSRVGLFLEQMAGYGRMLHYHKAGDATNDNPEWCGGHFDHGVFTGLMPAYYYRNGEAVPEPAEAGLYVKPTDSSDYEKIEANDKSVLYFQVGEFGQLISNDRIKATQHKVLKAQGEIERFTFALFYSASNATRITSQSVLNTDARYTSNQQADGSITYNEWQIASYARYRAK